MTQPSAPAAGAPRHTVFLAGAVIAVAVVLAYANSLGGPFVFDDVPAIPENATLHTWWRIDHVLFPPADSTVAGRPVLNASLALNYAVSGTAVWSYHLLNLAIHAAAALVLFGIVRRTLAAGPARAPAPPSNFHSSNFRTGIRPEAATLIGFAVGLLWALHPLVTEAVDYVVQRAEALMALLLLLTLYGFIRAIEAEGRCTSGEGQTSRAAGWRALSVACCALGMAAKENMAAAPLIVLCYDRAFVAGRFRAALRRRPGYYGGLAATWLILAGLILSTGGNRNGTVGFGTGVSVVAYWLTQPPALVRYLALSIWPAPLIFDYGTPWVRSLGEIWFPAALVIAVVAATVVAFVKNRPAGFLGAAALAILAPTSLVPGVSQMIVEHRMYLPLAVVITAGATGLWPVLGRRALPLLGALAVVLLGLTALRNTAYRSEPRLWTDTAAKRPDNARAYFTLAKGLQEDGRVADAIPRYQKAIALFPDYVEAHNNLGNALGELGRFADAVPQYEAALRVAPRSPVTHNNLGNALCALGRPAEAIPHYQRAIELKPDYAEAYINRGLARLQVGRPAEAVPDFQHALMLEPARTDAHAHLADALMHAGRGDEALPEFEAALQAEPRNATVRAMYAGALADAKRLDDALVQFGYAVAAQPDSAVIQYNYGATLLAAGRTQDAVRRFEAVLRLQPDFAPAREALAQIRAGAR